MPRIKLTYVPEGGNEKISYISGQFITSFWEAQEDHFRINIVYFSLEGIRKSHRFILPRGPNQYTFTLEQLIN